MVLLCFLLTLLCFFLTLFSVACLQIRAEGVPDDCEDFHAQCKTWAATGECQRNAGYMKGDGFGLGTCRRACEECEVCGPGDTECRSRNRVRAGYLALSEL